MTDEPAIYGPDELAERAGVSRRTVRYYVQRGLLPAPQGLGRGKHYGASHLARLIHIRDLQEQGVALEQVAERLSGQATAASPSAVAAQSVWTRVSLGEGIELHLRDRRLSQEQIQELSQLIQQTIGANAP